MGKAAEAFRTISEVADELDIPKHVLRFWELRFPQVKPMKRGGGRRYYRPEDVDLLRGIHRLLHGDGYTIRGVQKILRARGVEFVKARFTEAAGSKAKEQAARSDPSPRREAAPAPKRARMAGADAAWRGTLSGVVSELQQCLAILRAASETSAMEAGPAAKRVASNA